MIFLVGLFISFLIYSLHRYRQPLGFSPDGAYYRKAALGLPVPSPYSRRWLLPKLLGVSTRPWEITSAISFIISGALICSLFGPWATFFFVASTGLGALNVRLPVLVDMPAFMVAIVALFCLTHGHVAIAVALSVLAGACSEKAPVFVALWSWNPWCLLGLLGARWTTSIAKPDQEWLKHPCKAARESRDLLDWKRMLLPWGGLLITVPLLNFHALVALLVGYGQCLIAQDDSRLYQWAMISLFPLLAFVPAWLLPIAAVWHLIVLGLHRGT